MPYFHGDSCLVHGGRCQTPYLFRCWALIFSFNWNPGELSGEKLNGAITISALLGGELSI